jgi:hypothetical protein
MKKAVLIAMTAVMFACNNSANDKTDQAIDSLNDRKDTLLNNVDSSFDAKIDSLKDKKEELKDKFDSTIDAKKDSLKQKH